MPPGASGFRHVHQLLPPRQHPRVRPQYSSRGRTVAAVRIDDPVTYPQRYFPKVLLDHACVVALSVSGETPEIISYLSNLSFRNNHTISITNSAQSTVARLTDVNIATDIAKESYVEQDVTSQVPCLFTLEYIAKLLHEEVGAG